MTVSYSEEWAMSRFTYGRLVSWCFSGALLVTALGIPPRTGGSRSIHRNGGGQGRRRRFVGAGVPGAKAKEGYDFAASTSRSMPKATVPRDARARREDQAESERPSWRIHRRGRPADGRQEDKVGSAHAPCPSCPCPAVEPHRSPVTVTGLTTFGDGTQAAAGRAALLGGESAVSPWPVLCASVRPCHIALRP